MQPLGWLLLYKECIHMSRQPSPFEIFEVLIQGAVPGCGVRQCDGHERKQRPGLEPVLHAGSLGGA